MLPTKHRVKATIRWTATTWVAFAAWLAFGITLNLPVPGRDFVETSAVFPWPMIHEEAPATLEELFLADSGSLFSRTFTIGWPMDYLRQTYPILYGPRVFPGPRVGYKVDYFVLIYNLAIMTLAQFAIARSSQLIGPTTLRHLFVLTMCIALFLVFLPLYKDLISYIQFEFVLLLIYLAPIPIAIVSIVVGFLNPQHNKNL